MTMTMNYQKLQVSVVLRKIVVDVVVVVVVIVFSNRKILILLKYHRMKNQFIAVKKKKKKRSKETMFGIVTNWNHQKNRNHQNQMTARKAKKMVIRGVMEKKTVKERSMYVG